MYSSLHKGCVSLSYCRFWDDNQWYPEGCRLQHQISSQEILRLSYPGPFIWSGYFCLQQVVIIYSRMFVLVCEIMCFHTYLTSPCLEATKTPLIVRWSPLNYNSKWLRSCNNCMLFGIIWRGWSQPYQWSHPPMPYLTYTWLTIERPKVWKHGKFYKGSLCMRISACALYPVLFNDQLAVILGNEALHHWYGWLHPLHIIPNSMQLLHDLSHLEIIEVKVGQVWIFK